jgi:hypothetical protein
MYEFQERELLISILNCLVIKYTILPMTEYVEIICPNNQYVISIVSKGSTKTVLQELALDIFSACLKFNVNITIYESKTITPVSQQ